MRRSEYTADSTSWRGSPMAFVVSCVVAFLALLAFAASAEATQYQRSLEGTFGSVEPRTFEGNPEAIAVDRATGDVLVAQYEGKGEILRYRSDGTPAPFSARGGSNAIDGHETPQGELASGTVQIAIDESGGPTNGNIYVVQDNQFGAGPRVHLVDIFSSAGTYLGQLSGTEAQGTIKEVSGVAVDRSGAVYISGHFASEVGIVKYVPTANPPVNADATDFVSLGTGATRPQKIVDGVGASAGSLFASVYSLTGEGGIWVFDENDLGTHHIFADEASGLGAPFTVDPTTGNLIADASQIDFEAGKAIELAEFSTAAATAGEPLANLVVEFPNLRSVSSLAADASGRVYAAPAVTSLGTISGHVYVYSATPAIVPTVTLNAAANVSGTSAFLSGSINPSGVEVSDCHFEYTTPNGSGGLSWTHTVPCEGAIPTDSGAHVVHATISGLAPNAQAYDYRLVATNENGIERAPIRTFSTAHTVATEAATGVSIDSATLNGIVLPEGLEYIECAFEWGISTHAGYEHTDNCSPPGPAIEPDFSPHTVTDSLTGLEAGQTYRFRLVATNSEGTQVGKELSFQTPGAPQVSQVRASWATQTTAILEAHINPAGFPTHYRFDWGRTSSYGNEVPPDVEPNLGAGTDPLLVTAKVTGLSPGAIYHYRVVASNSANGRSIEASADKTLQTLNACGLPDGRCLEMVSPKDPGPAAQPGRFLGGLQIHNQAAEAPGSVAYVVEAGLPDAKRGTELLYQGDRGSAGWRTTELSSGMTERNERFGKTAYPNQVKALSPDLTCTVEESGQPVTGDPVAEIAIDAGGTNLYRRTADGSYTLITYLPPSQETLETLRPPRYEVFGMSDDCGRIFFNGSFRGVPGNLLEWSETGGIRNVGVIPSGSGAEVPTDAEAGGNSLGSQVLYHAVSSDGSRVFFSAPRLVGNNASEVGKTGVFVRIGGTVTKDVSLSQTSTPDTGAVFQGATPDGSRAYFMANAGLTIGGSASGTDLYEYDLDSESLTDVSVGDGEDVAEVVGLVGVADDGSHVYFAARGQLVPGRGGTLAENEADKVYSIYDASGGGLHYVGAIEQGTVENFGTSTGLARTTLAQGTKSKTSRVSSDGQYLLFESSLNLTGYHSGFREVFLYDAVEGAESLRCISCRQDGSPPVNPTTAGLHLNASEGTNPLYESQSLVVQGGRPEAFFVSRDRLAAGATEDLWNLYEWRDGQVFHVATEEPGTATPHGSARLNFAGASADGTDLYFFDGAALNWENPQGRPAVWDARVGGGFPQPEEPSGCDPVAEGSCRGPGAGSLSTPSAASNAFHGKGNVKEAGRRTNKHCAKSSRQAKRLGVRAKKMRGTAHKLAENGQPGRAAKLTRKARRLAKQAKQHSNEARRCRRGKRTHNGKPMHKGRPTHARARVQGRINHQGRAR